MAYHGSFDSWADVQREFGISRLEPDDVIYAEYDIDGYEGSADILFRERGKFFYVHGSHCSCYGLEESQWSPEEYTAEGLQGQMERANWGFFHDRKDVIMAAIEKYSSPIGDLATEYGVVQRQLEQAREDLTAAEAKVDALDAKEAELKAKLKEMLN